MNPSRSTIISATAVALAAIAAFSLGANAQTPAPARIIGYSVHAHSHYVLLQEPNGALRSCVRRRESALRDPQWSCDAMGTLPS